jgi:hypothetical protein
MNQRPYLTGGLTVTVEPSGKVIVTGGKFANAGCREAVQLGIVWAMAALSEALRENISDDRPVLSARG